MPLFIAELGTFTPGQVAFWAGVAGGLNGLVMAIAGPVWGILSDWYGHKRNVLRASFGAGAVMALTGLVQNVPQFLGRAPLMGGFTGVFPAILGLVGSLTPRARLMYAVGIIQAATFLGQTVGPLAGGFFVAWAGFRMGFLASGALLALSGLLVLLLVHESFHPTRSQDRNLRGLWADATALLGLPDVRNVFLVLLLVQMAPSVVLPTLPLLLEQLRPSEGVAWTGVLFTVMGLGTVVSAYGAGAMSARWGIPALFVAGGLLAAICTFIVAVSHSVILIVVLSAGVGLGVGALTTAASALVGRVAPAHRQGAAFGLVQSANALGFAVGPLLGGVTAALTGLRAAFWLEASLFLLIGLFTLGLRRRRS